MFMKMPLKLPFCIEECDFETIAALHAQIPEFQPATAEFFAARCAGQNYIALQARLQGEAAGYLVAYDRYRDGSFYCWMTGVSPQYRSCGVFSALAGALEDYARDEGYRALRLKTRNSRREMLHWLVKNDYQALALTVKEPISETRIEFIKFL